MTNRSREQTKLLNKLIRDCDLFHLKPNEAMAYIEGEFGQPISLITYYQKRSRLRSKHEINKWLSYFTRIGFVEQHRRLMDDALRIHDDRMKQFFKESLKQPRNERMLSMLNNDINNNIRLISDLMDSTPIVASIKARILQLEENHLKQTTEEKIGISGNRSTEGTATGGRSNPDAWTI
jgi:hypothetical protein